MTSPVLSEPAPRGTIVDTNSAGRFDLVLYDDGILCLRGTYVGVMIRGAGAGMVGAGGGGLGGAVTAGVGSGTGSSAGRRYENRRIVAELAEGRTVALARHADNHFHSRAAIDSLSTRKRPWKHSLTVSLSDGTTRVYSWKPALNRFREVQQLLATTYPDLVAS